MAQLRPGGHFVRFFTAVSVHISCISVEVCITTICGGSSCRFVLLCLPMTSKIRRLFQIEPPDFPGLPAFNWIDLCLRKGRRKLTIRFSLLHFGG